VDNILIKRLISLSLKIMSYQLTSMARANRVGGVLESYAGDFAWWNFKKNP
jgi:hypothetical protein